MTGMLLKDLLVLRKGSWVYLLLMVFYTAMGFADGNFGMLGGMTAIIVLIVPMNCFSWDNLAKWDTYAMTMPVSRKAIVAGRYLCALLIAIAALAYVALIGMVQIVANHADWLELTMTALACFAIGLFISAIMLPLLYKFGPEKARFLVIPIVGIPTALAAFLALQSKQQNITLPDLSWLNPYLPAIIVAVVVVALAVSFLISCRIYERKEA